MGETSAPGWRRGRLLRRLRRGARSASAQLALRRVPILRRPPGPVDRRSPTDVAWFGPQDASNVLSHLGHARRRGLLRLGLPDRLDGAWRASRASRIPPRCSSTPSIPTGSPGTGASPRRAATSTATSSTSPQPCPQIPATKSWQVTSCRHRSDGPFAPPSGDRRLPGAARRDCLSDRPQERPVPHPAGMFFGGTARPSARRTLEAIAADHGLARGSRWSSSTTTPASGRSARRTATERLGIDGYHRAVSTFGELGHLAGPRHIFVYRAARNAGRVLGTAARRPAHLRLPRVRHL